MASRGEAADFPLDIPSKSKLIHHLWEWVQGIHGARLVEYIFSPRPSSLGQFASG